MNDITGRCGVNDITGRSGFWGRGVCSLPNTTLTHVQVAINSVVPTTSFVTYLVPTSLLLSPSHSTLTLPVADNYMYMGSVHVINVFNIHHHYKHTSQSRGQRYTSVSFKAWDAFTLLHTPPPHAPTWPLLPNVHPLVPGMHAMTTTQYTCSLHHHHTPSHPTSNSNTQQGGRGGGGHPRCATCTLKTDLNILVQTLLTNKSVSVVFRFHFQSISSTSQSYGCTYTACGHAP